MNSSSFSVVPYKQRFDLFSALNESKNNFMVTQSLTEDVNSSITDILPYISTAFFGFNPSGDTRYISRRVFLAIRRFKSSFPVKWPVARLAKISYTQGDKIDDHQAKKYL